MDSRLHADITARLDRDYAFKANGKYLQQGSCPHCHKKSLWTWAESPWMIKCDRLAKCGAEYHVKELYPELFDAWSERHPVTETDPNAAADAYLRDDRRFDLARIKGWYSQELFWDFDQKIGSATVRFPVANAYWERLIDQPHRFERKAHFKKGIQYGHSWWVPPGLDLAAAKEVWITEGIFDAIALLHHDIAAVSALTCNNDCALSISALAKACADAGAERPTLVWALDGDKAGKSFAHKYVRQCRDMGWNCTAAHIPQHGRAKLDWSDMHQRGRLEKPDIEQYRYHGSLLVAESAGAKAQLMYSHGRGSTFPFDFADKLYWFKLDLEKFHKAMEVIEEANPDLTKDRARDRAMLEAHAITEIANCHPMPLYFQRHEVTDESWYYVRVSFPNSKSAVQSTFTAAQLASAAEFKKRLLGMANGAYYTGTTGQLDAWFKRLTENIPAVATVDFIGYAKSTSAKPQGCYILGEVAVQAGRLFTLNEDDYFELGKLSIKSLNQSVGLSINTKDSDFSTEWVRHLWDAFGSNGIVALAFWFGTLFAEQIREIDKSYPFLEVTGEPGAGKSTLLEFLWKCCGRQDYEGFDPSKSTLAARARNFAQVSNLPVVLIEGDRDSEGSKKGAFDWDELKTAFNGRSVRARGMKDGGNATYEPPFRGSVVISQNAQINASEAILSRIVYLHFSTAEHTAESAAAARALECMPMSAVSGFILRAARAEPAVMGRYPELVDGFAKIFASKDGILSRRIIDNHAQMAALVELLREVLPVTDRMVDAAHDALIEMARERQESISADHPFVQQFWEIYDYLEDDSPAGESLLNHARGEDYIAISLPHFEQVCADRHLRHAPLPDLKRVLATSRAHKFIGHRTVNSRINERYNRHADLANASTPRKPASVKCWTFKA